MIDTVIEVSNLSKRYVIGHQRTKGEGFRHLAEAAFRSPIKTIRSAAGRLRAEKEEFWAVNDVSFELKRGDLVGIIGNNGAGKSTVLKLLSRITEPTKGRITLRGRVASLLEVGTGFHPELTGRENIFLNGSILGMGVREIKRKLDEIVAFSEVERFLDTPVKRYSSGMYVRLAFAVAAHLEPEILIVDEVLAVGDATFQKKCLGKMNDVSNQGQTVLFVSHQMPLMARLCKRGILLEKGSIIVDGTMNEVIHRYRSGLSDLSKVSAEERTDRSGSGDVMVTRIEVAGDRQQGSVKPMSGAPLNVRLHYRCKPGGPHAGCCVSLVFRHEGELLFIWGSALARREECQLQDSCYNELRTEELPLPGGAYTIGVHIESNGGVSDVIDSVVEFLVVDGDFYGTGMVNASNRIKVKATFVKHTCEVHNA